MTTVDLPAYRVVPTPEPAEQEELRNDVAGFVGPTPRGPLTRPTRVTGPQSFAAVFGGARAAAGRATHRAVTAFFANGGEVCWVIRVGEGGAAAGTPLTLGSAAAGAWTDDGPTRVTLPGTGLLLEAISPGTWANGLAVAVTYRAYGLAGRPEFDVAVRPPGEAAHDRRGIPPEELLAALAASGHVGARWQGDPVTGDAGVGNRGPAVRTWTATLAGGSDPNPTARAYLDAVAASADVGEIALLAAPDVDALGAGDDERVIAALATSAAASQDRMVVLAAPDDPTDELELWTARVLGAVAAPAHRRAVAAYHPWLLSEDPAALGPDRYPATSPVGHVCGVIARLDRERGSGWSPANALVADAIDVTQTTTPEQQAYVIRQQVNLLRCRTGGGLEIWGARTLDRGDGRFVAHRRLVHRLVRAIRRVAEPLVFDQNTPVLWFTVVRAISGVLLEAFRSGALQGETPDQAYRVRCDDTTNPPEAIAAGRVVCEVEVAPAAPMEFITLRLTLGAEGLLEVVEA